MKKNGSGSSDKQRFCKFRLTACGVILQNLPDMQHWVHDINSLNAIAELCEQYCLLIVLNWLAAKHGFPAYEVAMEKDPETSKLPLLNRASLTDLYPLFITHQPADIKRIYDELETLVDEVFCGELEELGFFYQHTLAYPLSISDQNTVNIDLKSDKRISGEFYTPRWVADYAMSQWLKADSESILNRFKSENISFWPKIIDPACGSGNFLLAAMRFSNELGLEQERKLAFLRNCIFGADIDGRAVSLARILLLLSVAPELRALDFESREKMIVAIIEVQSKNITTSDTVLLASSALSAEQEPSCRTYDLVISNPPYISFGSRDQNTVAGDWHRFLKRAFPAASQYKLRLSSIFQELGTRLQSQRSQIKLAQGWKGQCILLVPDAFLNGSYYSKLRELLLEKVEITCLTELPDDTIAGATVGRWCLAHYSERERSAGAPESPESDGQKFLHLASVKHENGNLLSKYFLMPFDTFVGKDKKRFQLVFSQEDLEILRICRNYNFLKEEISGHTGIRSRLGQKAVIAESKLGQAFYPGIISGAELKAFSVNWQGNWLEITPEKLFAGGFDRQIISGPKLLLRQTADRLVAAVDSSGLYHLNNVHSFVPNKEYAREDLSYFFASLLNSSFFLYFYRLKTREHKRALAQVDIETVEHLPLPSLENHSSLVQDLVSIGRQLSFENKTAVPSKAKAAALPEREKKTLLQNLDQLVFSFYGLDKNLQSHVMKSLL